MKREFQRIVLKGPRQDRGLMLSAAQLVEQDHGPLDADGRKLIGVRMSGRYFSASLTKRSITITPL